MFEHAARLTAGLFEQYTISSDGNAAQTDSKRRHANISLPARLFPGFVIGNDATFFPENPHQSKPGPPRTETPSLSRGVVWMNFVPVPVRGAHGYFSHFCSRVSSFQVPDDICANVPHPVHCPNVQTGNCALCAQAQTDEQILL